MLSVRLLVGGYVEGAGGLCKDAAVQRGARYVSMSLKYEPSSEPIHISSVRLLDGGHVEGAGGLCQDAKDAKCYIYIYVYIYIYMYVYISRPF